MALDVYRSCTRHERREVLTSFWRSQRSPSERINQAALQYGPYAIASIAVIALELLLVGVIAIVHARNWGWIAGLSALVMMVALRWAIAKYATLKRVVAIFER